MTDLHTLAARVMALTGPDRGLLKDVFRAVYPEKVPLPIVANGYGWREDDGGWWLATGEDSRVPPKIIYPPAYFTSVDTAMSIIPAGKHPVHLLRNAIDRCLAHHIGDHDGFLKALPRYITAYAMIAERDRHD